MLVAFNTAPWNRSAAASASRGARAFTAVVFVYLFAIGPAALPAVAQEVTRVEEIRLSPNAHVNQIRTVEGLVDRLVSRGAGQMPAYYLEDDYGHQILVTPFEGTPARGDRVRVTGVINLDPAGDPVLTLVDPSVDPPAVVDESEAVEAETEPIEPVTDPVADSVPDPDAESETGTGEPGVEADIDEAAPQAAERPIWSRRWSTRALGIAALLAAAVALLFRRMGRDPYEPRPIVTGPRKDDVDFAVDALWPESEQEFDGRTMRFIRPDPTMQLLPARLEVVAGGDTGTEIPFVGKPGEDMELMIGRSPGDGPSTIELKQKTVSRTHAVIRFRDGSWLLENLSMTNPTILNDETLGVKAMALSDGDRIEMGEVVFVFKQA